MHASAGSTSSLSATAFSSVVSSMTTSGSWSTLAEAVLWNLRQTSANEPPWSLATSGTWSWPGLNPATMASMVCLTGPPMPPYQRVISTGPSAAASSRASSGQSGSAASPSPPASTSAPSPEPSPELGGSLQAAASSPSAISTTNPIGRRAIVPPVSARRSACVALQRFGHLVLGLRQGVRHVPPLEQHGVEGVLDGVGLVDVGPDQRSRLVGVGVGELLHGCAQEHPTQVVLPEGLHVGVLLHRLDDGQVAPAEVPGLGDVRLEHELQEPPRARLLGRLRRVEDVEGSAAGEHPARGLDTGHGPGTWDELGPVEHRLVEADAGLGGREATPQELGDGGRGGRGLEEHRPLLGRQRPGVVDVCPHVGESVEQTLV